MSRKIEPYKDIALIYEQVRPGYPKQLIQDIITATNIGPSSRLLEIGAGTGKATVQLAEKEFQIHAIELGKDMGYISESGGWDNIPDSLTDSSFIGKNQYTNKYGYPDGSLAGSGTSNHGLGSALDLNFGLAEEASIGSGIRHWVEDFGKGYGFWGYYKNDKTEYKETRGKGNFEESWHLNYYGPNGPKSRSK